MSWVVVESSNGSRYSAPSHGRPLPSLSGVAQLFQPPLSLRHLHTLDMVEADGALSFDKGGCCDGVGVSIVVEQRDLGGHLGITTVVAGCEQEEAEDSTVVHHASHREGESVAAPALRCLVERVFSILRSTNDRGVAVLLDAVCTRAPFPLTAAATARASTVVEDDGGPCVSAALTQARAQLPRFRTDVSCDTEKPSNLQFLQRVTQREASSVGNGHSAPLQLLPPNSALNTVRSAKAARTSSASPLSFATAVRRQALLYFVRHDVVPLSFLASRVEHIELSGRGRTTKTSADVTVHTLDSAALMDAGIVLHTLAQRIDIPGAKRATTPATPQSRLSCTPLLNLKASTALKRSALWAAATAAGTAAQTAEECGQVLLLAVFRLLVSQLLPQADVPVLERVLLREMWRDTSATSQTLCPPVMMMAAFSPSGLLTASGAFHKCFRHDEYVLLAAAAIDRLTRASSLSAPSATSLMGETVRWADVLRWTSWPMRVGAAGQTGVIVDVLLLTIGDALALYLYFPRGAQSSEPLPPAVAAVLSLTSVLRLLERTVAAADSRIGSSTAAAVVSTSVHQALVHACTHSTAPSSPAFDDALFVLNAVEEVLRNIHVNDQGRVSLTSLDASATFTVEHGVKDEVLQLMRDHLRHSCSAAHASPSTKEPSNVASAEGVGVSNSITRRQTIQKLFACLPHSRQGDTANAAAATHDRTTGSLPSGTTGLAAGLLALPLEYMLCCVAALLTRNERAVLRRAHEVGLHSFFFLQRAAQTRASEKTKQTPAVAAGGAARTTLMPPSHAATSQQSFPHGAHDALSKPRFGVAFTRLCLQQSHCPTALLPRELWDAAGMSDGHGGRLTFIEDPTLTLPMALQAHTHSTAAQSRFSESAVVSVLPTWSILHAVPVEPPLLTPDNTVVDVKKRHAQGDHRSNSSSEADEMEEPICGSSNPNEDAALLTSLSLLIPQRRARRPATTKTTAAAAAATVTRVDPSVHASGHSGPGAGQPASAGMRHSLSAALRWGSGNSSSGAGEREEAAVEVAAVMNVAGDIAGTRADALLRALRRHGLSKSGESKIEGSTDAQESTAAALESALADRGAVEAEYAAGAAAKVKELIHEAVLCQEAALMLLEGAACYF